MIMSCRDLLSSVGMNILGAERRSQGGEEGKKY